MAILWLYVMFQAMLFLVTRRLVMKAIVVCCCEGLSVERLLYSYSMSRLWIPSYKVYELFVTSVECCIFFPWHIVIASTCAEAGHTNGCCQINTTVYECWVPGGDCYCDVGCHIVHNCCPDILESKCFAPGELESIQWHAKLPSLKE